MALCKSTSRVYTELLTLDYDIPPPITAVSDYALGLKQLTANGQVFVGTQMAGRLEQTAQMMSDEVNMMLNVQGGGGGMEGGGRGRLYTYHYTVPTRMIPALRWAAMRAISMFQ